MRDVSVSRDGNQVNFRVQGIQLGVSWLPELEAEFEERHQLSFKDEITSAVKAQLVSAGISDEEIAEALLQFKNLSNIQE